MFHGNDGYNVNTNDDDRHDPMLQAKQLTVVAITSWLMAPLLLQPAAHQDDSDYAKNQMPPHVPLQQQLTRKKAAMP